MKILFVFNHPAPYKVALFNGLAKTHDIHVIFERFKAKNRHRSFYNEADYKFTTHKIKGISLGDENHLSFGVRRHLKNHAYDFIVMNGYSTLTEMIALRYLKRKKIPYAFYINGGIVKKEPKWIKRIKTYFISGASLYFSPAVKANEYLLNYQAPASKIVNYPYSTVYEKDIVKTKVPQQDKIDYWQKRHIHGTNFTICITSFIKRKNNFCLIKAWKEIAADHVLILVGNGEEEVIYKTYIKEHNLSNVYLLPFAPKKLVFEYLRHANNAVYLSNYDIYGHVINEALAHGLNVLTNNNMIAAVSLIVDGKNGLILHDGEDLTAKLNELFKCDFFIQAITSAVTIEDSINVHLRLLEKPL